MLSYIFLVMFLKYSYHFQPKLIFFYYSTTFSPYSSNKFQIFLSFIKWKISWTNIWWSVLLCSFKCLVMLLYLITLFFIHATHSTYYSNFIKLLYFLLRPHILLIIVTLLQLYSSVYIFILNLFPCLFLLLK